MSLDRYTFRINTDERHQLVRDFGQSACWWGSGIGTTDKARKVLRLLHTKDGLDLNVIRLNVGGSVKDDRSDAPYPEDSLSRRAPLSPLSEDGTYDLHRDGGMLSVAREALKLGTIDDFTIFMNTPPSCMTKSGMTCANEPEGEEKYVSNLAPERYQDYADYVADVTALYLDEGIPVKYVSPINEPQWQWDRNNRQEGCHYEADEVIAFLRIAVATFARRAETDPRFKSVRISMPETAQWYYPRTHAFGLYQAMCDDPLLRKHADHFAAHSYGTNAAHKREFREFTESLGSPFPLHQTEWGPLHADCSHPMEFALELANCLYEDLTILDVPHWTWWTGLAGTSYPSGLIDEDPDGESLILTKRYYVMMHHSRFIRGCTRIGVSGDAADTAASPDKLPEEAKAAWDTIAEKKWEKVASSAYISEDGERIEVIVINNQAETAALSLILPEGFDGSGRLFLTDAGHDCADMGAADASDISLPPLSVATFELKKRNKNFLRGDNK